MYHKELAVCFLLLALPLLVFAFEYRRHVRLRNRLRVVILANGTRGKSSTVRLVAAGLRAGEHTGPVLAKTTGTSARWILPDGSERKIHRAGPANIREMAQGLALAENIGAEAYVAECMAVRAEYQSIVEKWLRADVTVITNVRPDHEDAVGEGRGATARSLAASLPRAGVLVAHEPTVRALEAACHFPRERIVVADPDFGAEWLPLFCEPVVPENLSLALTVCAMLGVPSELAAPAMAAAAPDPGNLERLECVFNGRNVSFVGAFAANDPESTLLLAGQYPCPPGYMNGLWIHGRPDRRQRGAALCRALAELRPDFLLVSGDAAFLRREWAAGICRYGVFSLPLRREDEVSSVLTGLPPGDIRLFGAGNAKGMTAQTLGGTVLCRNLSLV